MNQIDIIGSQWDNILILAPVKLVVVPVLREVRFQQADTRYDTAGNERVVGTVITISHPFGLIRTNGYGKGGNRRYSLNCGIPVPGCPVRGTT